MPIQSAQAVAAPNSTIASGKRTLGDFNHFVMEDTAPIPFQTVFRTIEEKDDNENCEPVILRLPKYSRQRATEKAGLCAFALAADCRVGGANQGPLIARHVRLASNSEIGRIQNVRFPPKADITAGCQVSDRDH
jgi:hypothetical protein